MKFSNQGFPDYTNEISHREIDPKYSIEVSVEGQPTIVNAVTREPVPADEPLILFRARDRHALNMLHFYRSQCMGDGCTDSHLRGIDNRIEAFRQFALDHPERMKQPGITGDVREELK